MEQAAAADDRTARGGDLGPLHGLPITIKDAIEVAGLRSTGGATDLRTHIPEFDAPAVAIALDCINFGAEPVNVHRLAG